MGDLSPAPVSSDKYSSIMTEPELKAFLADFRASVLPDTQAVLMTSLKTPEARYFLQRYPSARRMTLSYAGEPYYVPLRRD